MKTSMQDIATKLGISRSTVSLVLSGKAGKQRIAVKTAERIIAAARELGFRRNELAASVKSGRSRMIAFIGGACTDYHMKMVAGASAKLSESGYGLRIFDIFDGTPPEVVADRCISGMIDGVIVGSVSDHYLAVIHRELVLREVPAVLVGESKQYDWCRCVDSDDRSGAEQAVVHLANLGRRRIGLFSNQSPDQEQRPRHIGYYDGLRRVGLARQAKLEYYCVPESHFPLLQRQKIAAFLQRAKPDAVFCVGDPGAMRLLHVANSLGIRIPQDLAVVGFADLEYAQYSSPPLTTLRQPFHEMGRQAAGLILESLENECAGTSVLGKDVCPILLPVELVVRDSTIGSAQM